MIYFLRALAVCVLIIAVSLHAGFQARYLIIEIDQVPLGSTSLLESVINQEFEFKILENKIYSNGKSSYVIQVPTDVNKLSTFLTILAEDLPSLRFTLKDQETSEKTFQIHGFEIQGRKMNLEALLQMGILPQTVSKQSIQFKVPVGVSEDALFRSLSERGISAVSAKYEIESQNRSVYIFTITIKKDQNADKFSKRLFKRYPEFKFVSSRRSGDVLNINYRIILDPSQINVESEVARLRANLIRWVGVSDVIIKSQGLQTVVTPNPDIAKVDAISEPIQKTILHIRPKNKSDLVSLESHVQAIQGVLITSIHEMTTNSMVMAVIDSSRADEISTFLRAHPLVLRVIQAPQSEVESYLAAKGEGRFATLEIRELNAKQILVEISCRNYFHGF